MIKFEYIKETVMKVAIIVKWQKGEKMKKTKLKYRSAVTRIPPVKKVAVSSCNLEKLDLAIASKVEQNQKE